jgi:hypothetical protein
MCSKINPSKLTLRLFPIFCHRRRRTVDHHFCAAALSPGECVSAFVADLISFYFALRSTSHSPGGSGGDFFVHCKTSSHFSCRNFPALSCFVIHYHNHSILGTCNVNLYTPLSLSLATFLPPFSFIFLLFLLKIHAPALFPSRLLSWIAFNFSLSVETLGARYSRELDPW